MTFSYSTTYILDKPHFAECYSQSVSNEPKPSLYYKAAFLTLVGLAILIFSEANRYVAWFILALGVLDAVSVYYQKPWWVMRQMLSRAAGSEVTITVDEQGISNHSYYVKQSLTWQNIQKIEATKCGLLIFHPQGKNYLSKSILSEDAYQYILQQSASSSEQDNSKAQD